MSEHVVLLGDSILDNGAYTGGAPDVVTVLGELLPDGWRATLCAIDGSTTQDLAGQLRMLPADASRLVVSIGGNDALGNVDLLATPVGSTTEALEMFASRIHGFERAYGAALDGVLARGLPTIVCTIYNGAFEALEARVARVALMTFNDVVLRAAFARELPVLDLRTVCTEPGDYVNQIEPSGAGGRKIAEAIARHVRAPDVGGSRVWSS